MTQNPNIKRINIFVFDKRYSKNCDTVSVRFEIHDLKLKLFKLIRYYFDYSKLLNFYYQLNNSKTTIPFVKTSIRIIDLNQYNNCINRLIKNNYISIEHKESTNNNKFIYKELDYINFSLCGVIKRSGKITKLDNPLSTALKQNVERFKNYLENDFNKFVPKLNVVPNELRIYNVGQANCEILFRNNVPLFVFDLGKYTKRINIDLNNSILKLNRNSIILISHLDSDHYNYFYQLSSNSFAFNWIIPDHNIVNMINCITYQNFITYLRISHSKIHLMHLGTTLPISSYLELYRCPCVPYDPCQSTLRNSESIISTLISDKKKILIPADSLYTEFPKSILSNVYTEVIIPHHGCNYDYNPGIAILNSITNIYTQSYVLCSGRRHYHAQINHINLYNNVNCFSCSLFFNAHTLQRRPRNVSSMNSDYYSISL